MNTTSLPPTQKCNPLGYTSSEAEPECHLLSDIQPRSYPLLKIKKCHLIGDIALLAVALLFVGPAMAHYHQADDDIEPTKEKPGSAIPAVNPLTAEQQQVQDAIVADALENNVGYEFLGHLCDDHGGRLTGSPANHAALLSTVEALRAVGVEARLQTFKMPGWVRMEDEATMVAPIKRKLRATALSYVQPHEAFEADVIDLGNGSKGALEGLDTEGKIGLLGPNAATKRGGYNEYANMLGLRGIIRTCRVTGGQLLCRTGSFEGEPIELPVYSVTQEEGKWMSRSLARGKPVRVRLHTRSYNKEIETANIVVTFPGRTADTVIVGAHFDSWDLGQGAMDNGLGTAQVFALAKLLHDHAPKNLRTIELVWFNGEEQGLWGSFQHAPTVKDRPIAVMLNLDMVGYPNALNAMGFADLVPKLEQFNVSLGDRVLENGVTSVNWFGSDHTPYQVAGIRAITFGGPIPKESVRYYHDFGDTFDKIEPKMLAESSATIAALTYWLANAPDLKTNRQTEEEIKENFKNPKILNRMRNSGIWPSPPDGKNPDSDE